MNNEFVIMKTVNNKDNDQILIDYSHLSKSVFTKKINQKTECLNG